MSPLPWLEAGLPVLLPLFAVVLFAAVVRALVPKVVPAGDRVSAWAAAIGVGALGLFAGHDALGPDLGGDAHRALGWAFGGVLALLGTGLTLRRLAEPGTPRLATTILAFAIGLVPAAFWLGVERAVHVDDADAVSEERARWHRRLQPNDARGWLALAIHARSKGQNEHALAMAEVAEVLAPEDDRFRARIFELRSDVRAAEGDCDEAHALFRQALEARARAAMESLDLDLGESYRMPRALAAECGYAPE